MKKTRRNRRKRSLRLTRRGGANNNNPNSSENKPRPFRRMNRNARQSVINEQARQEAEAARKLAENKARVLSNTMRLAQKKALGPFAAAAHKIHGWIY